MSSNVQSLVEDGVTGPLAFDSSEGGGRRVNARQKLLELDANRELVEACSTVHSALGTVSKSTVQF